MVEPTHILESAYREEDFCRAWVLADDAKAMFLHLTELAALRSDILPTFSSGTIFCFCFFLLHSCVHSFWHTTDGNWV